MRFDLACLLCCCRPFLPNKHKQHSSLYDLLHLSSNATPEDLRRAYKRQSLALHPDKLLQRGQVVTLADRQQFTRMKYAYEVLSDPHRREIYDALGEDGLMVWEDPLRAMNPSMALQNLASSSKMVRIGFFAMCVALCGVVCLGPILLCGMGDGRWNIPWSVMLTPLWLLDGILLVYHWRMIRMGPIPRPESIPPEEWMDPLPMQQRVFAMIRCGLLVWFEVWVALHLDGILRLPYWMVFVPLFLWEGMGLVKKIRLANRTVVTPEEVALAMGGKTFEECTPLEKEEIHRRFVVVPVKEGMVYDAACTMQQQANEDVLRIVTRVLFWILLLLQLQFQLDWSYWLIFVPIWILSFGIVGAAFRRSNEARAEAARRDPHTFAPRMEDVYAKMEETTTTTTPITDEEREELKAKVMHTTYTAVGTCFSQCFFLFLLCLFVAKLEGASYSYIWIISPFLAFGAIVLCCLACTIFCITEVDEYAGMAAFDSAVEQAVAAAAAAGNATTTMEDPTTYQPPVESTWDPEKGQVWTTDDPRKPPPLEGSTPVQQNQTNESIPTQTVTNPSYDLD